MMCVHGRLLMRGLYDQQLARWRRHFPPESFCVLSSDYLLSNTTEAGGLDRHRSIIKRRR